MDNKLIMSEKLKELWEEAKQKGKEIFEKADSIEEEYEQLFIKENLPALMLICSRLAVEDDFGDQHFGMMATTYYIVSENDQKSKQTLN